MKQPPLAQQQTAAEEQPSPDQSGFYRARGSGPRLVGFSALFKGKVFPLGSTDANAAMNAPMIVGAADSCAIRITGSTMCDYHAALQQVDSTWVISRIDASASLWINGEPLEFAVLEEGDQIQIGRHVFLLFF